MWFWTYQVGNLILKFRVGCALGQVIEMGANLLEGYNFKFQSISTDKNSNLTMNEKQDQNQESEMPDIWYWDF